MSEFDIHQFEILRGSNSLNNLHIPTGTGIGPEWGPHTFREYLLRLGSRKQRLRLSEVPSIIELNEPLHHVLNQMRKEHTDGYERFSPIGYHPKRKSLHVAKILTTGDKNHVTFETQLEVIKRAFEQGIENSFGSIHSHQTMYGFVVNNKYVSPTFSLNDIYRVIIKHWSNEIEFLADDHTNQLLLPTSDTKKVTIDDSRVSQEEYVKKTSQEYLNFQDDLIEHSENGFKETDAKYWKMTIDQCRQYKVGLYRGLPNKHLIRIYP